MYMYVYVYVCTALLVIIQFYLGQPVGWCISDTEASEVIEIFLSCIKARSPTTTVRVVMTDDGKRICALQVYDTMQE